MPATFVERSTYSSAELPAFDAQRSEEVARRHQLLARYLDLQGYGGLLLQRAANIAWLTCGADLQSLHDCSCSAAVFVNHESRVLLTNNVDSQQLFDGPFAGLGFQLKERPWHEPRERLLADLCRGRKIASDAPIADADVVDPDLADFRMQLGGFEESTITELGRDIAHAVEATARTCELNAPEVEVAGQLAHRLIRRQITPVKVQVIADGQNRRHRHWGPTEVSIGRFAVISAVGRRRGLHVGLSRTVSFGGPPEDLVQQHAHASLLLATGMYFSQAGWRSEEVFSRMRRIYEKFGAAEEWRLADQGEVVGYDVCEHKIGNDSARQLVAGQPVFWHPSVGNSLVGDSILIKEEGFVPLTSPQNWPTLSVQVKGTALDVPAILVRELGEEYRTEEMFSP